MCYNTHRNRIVLYGSNRTVMLKVGNIVNCSQVISREVFCHEYGKIPRHTGKNAITEGDLECILTKLLRTE